MAKEVQRTVISKQERVRQQRGQRLCVNAYPYLYQLRAAQLSNRAEDGGYVYQVKEE